ncbi:MAG: protein-disulfide reductase DsbD domain-containing protein, partial [Myxococcota bacterium]
MRSLLVALVLACFLPAPVALAALPDVPPGAIGGGAPDEDEQPTVEARLLFDAATAASGQTLRLGVLFEAQPGWHLYWRNPGDTGFPTRLTWHAPGLEIGPTRWPVPEVFTEDDTLTTYGYEHVVLLRNEAHVSAPPGASLDVSVDADFLVCKVQCIPGRITLSRALPVATAAVPADAATLAQFAIAELFTPRPAEELGLVVDAVYSQSAIRPGDRFQAALSIRCDPEAARCPQVRGLRHPAEPGRSFAPEKMPSLRVTASGSRAHPAGPGARIVTLEGQAFDEDVRPDRSLAGVLQLVGGAPEGGPREMFVSFAVDLPRAEAGAAVEARPGPWLLPEPPPAAPV